MLYLTQAIFVPWLLTALALGIFVGWWSMRRTPPRLGLGWLGGGAALFVVALFVAGTLVVPGRLGLWFDTALHFVFWYIIGCCLGSLMALAGMHDGRTEPVAAWVKPVRSEGPATEPPAPGMAAWVQVLPRASVDPRSIPTLQAAGDWLDVLRRQGGPDTAAVPAWVKPIAPSATAAAVSPPSTPWQAVRAASGVTLTGSAPSEEARRQMVAEAGKLLAAHSVKHRLRIDPAAAGIEAMAATAFGHLAKLDSGIASVVDGRYTLSGVVHKATDREALIEAAAKLPGGFMLDRVEIAKPAAPSGDTDAAHDGERPVGLDGPRGGKADDLKRIRGIGPQNEGRLHGLGIWHFDQIAAWSVDNALWVGSYLAFPGRIEREDWVGQAKLLAAGVETNFSKRVARGEVQTSKDDGTLGAGNVEAIKPLRAVGGVAPKPGTRTPKG